MSYFLERDGGIVNLEILVEGVALNGLGITTISTVIFLKNLKNHLHFAVLNI